MWLSSARVLAHFAIACQAPWFKPGPETGNDLPRLAHVTARTWTDCVVAVGALACAFGAVVLLSCAVGAAQASHIAWVSALPLALALDDKVPAVLFKVSRYPLSHGSLGAIRSLGRLGVPVHAVVEDRLAPYSFSRYLKSRILMPAHAMRDPLAMPAELVGAARRLGEKPILIPTDDEAALLLSRHAEELRPHFRYHDLDPELVSALASKHGLSQLCRKHDVPTPQTCFARSPGEVAVASRALQFPVVVKNSEPWIRLSTPAVGATTVVATCDQLLEMAAKWEGNPQIIIQEYIPTEHAEDWIFHAYCDRASRPLAAFTGLKQRSWPPRAGVTTAAISLPNEQLRELATGFLRAIGYRGIVDMDWRLDRRDGQYKLLDFNPRTGANFRLFTNENDVDVIRAMHLDLTGRPTSYAPQRSGRRLIVENLDMPSRLLGGRGDGADKSAKSVEYAWFAVDDPLPFAAMAVRFGAAALTRLPSMILGATGIATRPRIRPTKAPTT